ESDEDQPRVDPPVLRRRSHEGIPHLNGCDTQHASQSESDQLILRPSQNRLARQRKLVLEPIPGIERERQLSNLQNCAKNHDVNKNRNPWRTAEADGIIPKPEGPTRKEDIDQESRVERKLEKSHNMLAGFILPGLFHREPSPTLKKIYEGRL